MATRAALAVTNAKRKIKIGKDTLSVSTPTLRTLICASAEIGKLPPLTLKDGHEFSTVVGYAEYCEPIASALAMLLCGVKPVANVLHTFKMWRIKRRMLYRYTPRELQKALIDIIKMMEIKDFFALTTSLAEINLTKPTKSEVVGTTQSGQ